MVLTAFSFLNHQSLGALWGPLIAQMLTVRIFLLACPKVPWFLEWLWLRVFWERAGAGTGPKIDVPTGDLNLTSKLLQLSPKLDANNLSGLVSIYSA